MSEDDPGLMPRRPVSKFIYVVVALGLTLSLCTLACWLGGGIAERIACNLTNIDTPEQCP